MFAFDGTYLEPRLSQIALHSKRGLVGGMWKTGAEATCFLDLEDDGIDIAGVPKSSNMLECLVWDPSARQKNCQYVHFPLNTTFDQFKEPSGLTGTYWTRSATSLTRRTAPCVASSSTPTYHINISAGCSTANWKRSTKANCKVYRFFRVSPTWICRQTPCPDCPSG